MCNIIWLFSVYTKYILRVDFSEAFNYYWVWFAPVADKHSEGDSAFEECKESAIKLKLE